MKKSEHISELESLAASQWGMFTAAQAQNIGVRRNQISRMVDSGRVELMCRGVYRFVAGGEPDQAAIKAAWLSVFPKLTAAERLSRRPLDAVLAGRSAAFALGAGDFLASPYTFIVRARRQTSREDMRFLQCRLDDDDVVFADGIPVTCFERTVFDLLRLDEDPDLVDKFMRDAAWRAGHTFDGDRLATLLSPLAARFGFDSGASFSADLIARNVAAVQIEKAGSSINQTLSSLYGKDTLASINDEMGRAAMAFTDSQAFEGLSRAVAHVQEEMKGGPAYVTLLEGMKSLAETNAGIYPGLAKALSSIPSSAILQAHDWDSLSKNIAAQAIALLDEKEVAMRDKGDLSG